MAQLFAVYSAAAGKWAGEKGITRLENALGPPD